MDWVLVAVAGVAVIRVVLQTMLETPVPSTDHVFYREAGVSWAAGEGFRVSSVSSRVPGIERYFAAYPPVFPLIFGAWTWLFGFSFRSHFLFAGLLQGALILVMYRLVSYVGRNLEPTSRLLLAAICVTMPNLYDRPESLALPLLLLALRVSLDSGEISVKNNALSAFLFVIATLTSPVPALLFLGWVCLFQIASDGASWGQGLGKAAAFGGLVVGSAVFTFLATLGFDASLIGQVLRHAAITGVRHSLGDQWFATVPLAASIGLILSSAIVIQSGRPFGLRAGAGSEFYLPLMICGAATLYFVFVRTQWAYLVTLLPLTLVIWSLAHRHEVEAASAQFQPTPPTGTRLRLGRALLVPALALSSVPVSLDILHGLNIAAQPGQTFEAATQDLRRLIPEDSRVAAEPAFWYVLRDHAQYTDVSWMLDGYGNGARKQFEYIVMTGNGVGVPATVRLVPEGYYLCVDRLNRQPLTIAGYALTRSAWGYGYRLYASSEQLCKYSEATASSFPQLFSGRPTDQSM